MQVDRLSITMDPKLGAAVRRAAKRAKMSVSAWISEASADRVRNELLGQALAEWEADQGPFDAEELGAAAKTLGVSAKRRPKRK
jgi:hypothetical protein